MIIHCWTAVLKCLATGEQKRPLPVRVLLHRSRSICHFLSKRQERRHFYSSSANSCKTLIGAEWLWNLKRRDERFSQRMSGWLRSSGQVLRRIASSCSNLDVGTKAEYQRPSAGNSSWDVTDGRPRLWRRCRWSGFIRIWLEGDRLLCVTCPARWNVSRILWMNLMNPSGQEHFERGGKTSKGK